ncbi:hypothetical protein [Saccharopolyspora hattusasensis]|uniref:hypothetical protein n=1 Tax=Saccharopolyspora hattusasensis TaxID=1128679 RepID=UPI003D95BA11
MKKIPHEQSRRNAARRRRKVAARHARAGHWGAQSKPMLHSGTVSYEIGGNVDATCFGGIAAVHRLVTKLGLADQQQSGVVESAPALPGNLGVCAADRVIRCRRRG